MNKHISIVIPAYKKTDEFLKLFKHNQQFIETVYIVIVNDDPETSIRHHFDSFKNVTIVENTRNLGFSGAVNMGIAQVTTPYVMLLNTDVKLMDSTFLNTLKHFKSDMSLFAVTPGMKERDNSIVGKSSIYWKKGFFHHKKADSMDFGINANAEAGASIYSVEKLHALGLFDELFAPFYWEDTDISYRALKRGYKIIFQPEIMVEHFHETTIKSFNSRSKIITIGFRNQLIFIWKNIHDARLVQNHILRLCVMIPSAIIRGQWEYAKGFFQALRKLPAILTARNYEKQHAIVSDRTILTLFSNE